MEAEFLSLFAITLTAFICPVLAAIIPKRLIPETAFLLVAGMILGPYVLKIVYVGEAINLLSDLGLGFLFLLAGYELNIKQITGHGGRHGFLTWVVTMALALAIVVGIASARGEAFEGLAMAIALTTTAFGTLVPILAERELVGTKIGDGVIEYGSWGELCPVIAIALLLGTRAQWLTILILLGFVLLAAIAVLIPKTLTAIGSKISNFVTINAETNSQMSLRAVMVLLIGLVSISAVFDLDIVLGAFAAGIALRAIIPKGDESLEHKLRGIGYGVFIPLFFVVSGTGINPRAIADEPLLLLAFIAMLLLIRAVPIYISLSVRKDLAELPRADKAYIAFYCTTALPLIVAVTTIAVDVGVMTTETSSVLIAAGGITVLLMPLLAMVVRRAAKIETANSAAEQAAGSPAEQATGSPTAQRRE